MTDERREPSYDEAIQALRARLDEPVDARLLDDVQRRVRLALTHDGKQELSRRGIVIGFAAAAAIVVAGVALIAVRRAPPNTQTVAKPPGLQVELAGTTTSESLLGRRMVVGEHGRAVVTLTEGARIEVDGPARINGTEAGQFVLESGRAVVSVEKQAPGRRVVLGMGDVTVTVHGTRFVMVADDGRGLGVTVDEGVVEVRPASTPSAMLHAGERWERPAPTQEESAAEPKPVREAPPPGAPGKKPKVNLRAAAEQAMSRRDCEETRVLVGRYIAETTDVAEQARAATLEAECWLRANEKQRALPVLDRIAERYAGQPGAQSALFEAAAARADLKQFAEAVTGFDAYLRRYPKGSFAEPAAFRRCELINQLNGHEDASTCLTAFAERFPGGRRAGDALLLAGSLACADERFADASRAYWTYLERVVPERDDATNLESLVRCIERGKTADGPRAREALQRRRGRGTTP